MSTTAPEHHASYGYADPYAVDTTDDYWPAPANPYLDTDYLLAPPNPAERLSYTIDTRDRHRLDLHAALTTAGIPPRPEDSDAIDQLSALPAGINATLQRWLHHTA
ncbi:hypothetical protein [Streptomyces galilaeus]|uniref:hypothetical protein n=1 Tax=Streptomyces galilaeus TaxID=33899 RepID=UPI0019BE5CEF|nr:hypothetical protein [Streptomyces galilaeus]GGW78712.1 hypothetical protein GCM10010350_74600 [Streptomyces galilaeus]